MTYKGELFCVSYQFIVNNFTIEKHCKIILFLFIIYYTLQCIFQLIIWKFKKKNKICVFFMMLFKKLTKFSKILLSRYIFHWMWLIWNNFLNFILGFFFYSLYILQPMLGIFLYCQMLSNIVPRRACSSHFIYGTCVYMFWLFFSAMMNSWSSTELRLHSHIFKHAYEIPNSLHALYLLMAPPSY